MVGSRVSGGLEEAQSSLPAFRLLCSVRDCAFYSRLDSAEFPKLLYPSDCSPADLGELDSSLLSPMLRSQVPTALDYLSLQFEMMTFENLDERLPFFVALGHEVHRVGDCTRASRFSTVIDTRRIYIIRQIVDIVMSHSFLDNMG